jgi:hypothetical protein
MDFRQALGDMVRANREKLSCACDVREESGILRIVLTLDRPVFDYRQSLEKWMFGCVLDALELSGANLELPLFRGIDQSSLERALRYGIDVQPTNAHWYGDALEKALEYGGDYPAVLIIAGRCVERPYRTLAVDASVEDHVAAKAWAVGDAMQSENGQWLRYSRLPINDRQRGSPYETAYSWYIPGDAKIALLGVIECVPSQ